MDRLFASSERGSEENGHVRQSELNFEFPLTSSPRSSTQGINGSRWLNAKHRFILTEAHGDYRSFNGLAHLNTPRLESKLACN